MLRWPSRTAVRWTVLFLLFSGLTWALMLLFIAIARQASRDTSAITTTAAWLALIPVIFIITMLASLFFVHRSWRSAADQKDKWKQFWNVVEIVWLVGSGVGVFNIIVSQATILTNFAAASHRDEALALLPSLTGAAEDAKQKFCTGEMVDASACALIERMSRLSEANIDIEFMGELLWAAERLEREQPTHPAIAAFRSLQGEFFQYIILLQSAKIELRTRLDVAWLQNLLLFTPHIFAFVFPLRFGRALAAFRL